jgi:DNA-binding MarR family transcriptional regulator
MAMRLEEEIKTKQFRNQRHKLHVNIIYTYNWLLNRSQKVMHSYGITSQQYNVLRILRGQFPNPCNVQLLKERMLDKQSDVSRLVDRLVQKQLIERKTSAKDRRKLDILISKAGLDLLQRMDPEVAKMEEYSSHITEEEARQINELLDQLRGGSPIHV